VPCHEISVHVEEMVWLTIQALHCAFGRTIHSNGIPVASAIGNGRLRFAVATGSEKPHSKGEPGPQGDKRSSLPLPEHLDLRAFHRFEDPVAVLRRGGLEQSATFARLRAPDLEETFPFPPGAGNDPQIVSAE
jgi:hypothetical protein